MMGTILISLDVLSLRARPDIAAAWSAMWGRIPWWDQLLLVAGSWGSLVYRSYTCDRAHFREALALGVLLCVAWGGNILASGGPLEGGGWPWELAGGGLTFAAVVWWVVELARAPPRGGRLNREASAQQSLPSGR